MRDTAPPFVGHGHGGQRRQQAIQRDESSHDRVHPRDELFEGDRLIQREVAASGPSQRFQARTRTDLLAERMRE